MQENRTNINCNENDENQRKEFNNTNEKCKKIGATSIAIN